MTWNFESEGKVPEGVGVFRIRIEPIEGTDLVKVPRSDLDELQTELNRVARIWKRDRWAMALLFAVNLILWWHL